MISINQYPTTDPKTGKIVVPPPIVLNGEIDLVFQDNLRWKTYYANITGFPVPILLWSGEKYQAEAGEQQTQAHKHHQRQRHNLDLYRWSSRAR